MNYDFDTKCKNKFRVSEENKHTYSYSCLSVLGKKKKKYSLYDSV